MVDYLATARTQLAEARRTAQEQRALIEQERKKIREAEKQLISAERKLPVATQKLLRRGMYRGLGGRKRRRQVSVVRRRIAEEKAGLEKGRKRLSLFEKEQLTPYEQQIAQKERALAEYERKVREYEYGRKLAREGKLDPYMSKIARQGYLDEQERLEYLKGMREVVGEAPAIGGGPLLEVPVLFQPPPEGVILKPSEVGATIGGKTFEEVRAELGEITGGPVTVGIGQPLSSEQLKALSKAYTERYGGIPKFTPPRFVSRTEMKKTFAPMASVDFSKIFETTRKITEPFRTTGSPIRITPLVSAKSARPPVPKPVSIPKTTPTFYKLKKGKPVKGKKVKKKKGEVSFLGKSDISFF